MIQKITLFLLIVFNISARSQIINEAPYILTVDELKAWTQTGSTADPSLIATEDLASRFINPVTQFNPNLSNDMEIAYLPDGMNNFGNYGTEQSQFNLYNFTNWSYIDKLVWFGGTADQTVQLPSAPWANTAHKNGVEIMGNVFFAPNAFGGSTATVLNFLEQDTNGDFLVIPRMIDIMEYYNFDGWFINMETNTTPTAGQLMYEFVRDFTAQVEALGKDVMWYDAMLLNGGVNWQNRLTENNSVFVQNDEDNDPGNGFEQRVSSNIFINFFWSTSSFPSASRDRANVIGRSSFDVFTGVDVWPGRNQSPFQTGGNIWMSLLHENTTTPFTSLGLFAPNCVYNNSIYSIFNTDPSDYANFYSEERHMFAGADRNPALEDATGFKGYSNWIPAISAIQELPFETNFNTGHGLKKFTEGVETSSNPWHNMNDQDILPTWQFAFSENNVLSAAWDFENAYNGGSSLKIDGNLLANEAIDLTLYKTKLLLTADLKIDIVFNYSEIDNTQMSLLLTFADNPTETVQMSVAAGTAPGWFGRTLSLDAFMGRELTTIGLRFFASEAIPNYAINIGNMKVHDGIGLGLDENELIANAVTLIYPSNHPNYIELQLNTSLEGTLKTTIYTMQGRQIETETISENSANHQIFTGGLSKGIYLLKVVDERGNSVVKKMLVR